MHFRAILRAGCLALTLLGAGQGAMASFVVCDEAVWRRNHYGEQARAAITVRQRDQGAFIRAVEAYADTAHLIFAEVSSEDTAFTPPFVTHTPILQSQSVDIAIHVTVDNRHDLAEFSIQTFSQTCGPTEDWRPYWRSFAAFMADWPRWSLTK
jgi:hypothetical protein